MRQFSFELFNNRLNTFYCSSNSNFTLGNEKRFYNNRWVNLKLCSVPLILFLFFCIILDREGTRVESRSRIPLLFYSSWKSESGENSIFHYLNFLLRNSREKEKNQMNNSNPLVHIYEPLLTTGEEKSVIRHYLRKKRGFFDKAHEKQRLEEEYDRSFRLFWFLGGVAIVFFICIFILTLLCFCCPNLTKKGKKTSIPRISTTIEPDMDGPISSELLMNRLEVERARSASVFSTNALYIPHHRLSQEQVNTIQIQSQSRRGSQLPSTSQGLTVSSALIDEKSPKITVQVTYQKNFFFNFFLTRRDSFFFPPFLSFPY